MRQLWTQPLVEFKGRWHNIPDAGLNPLPVQRPIPIWIGGYAEVVLQRMAKLADGWMPMVKDTREAQIMLERIDGYLESAGRSRSDIGIEARISYADGNPDTWIKLLRSWETIGATHISFNTMNSGLNTPGDHLAAVQKFSSVLSSL
jgi:alkanesulfonate monooxygenase SsuD/methylene tetrahydromethanopterin reductase-like flavin-dependent oxidoreductase (luciferase family)